MKLYDYYRSSACYRVRIALNIKKLSYDKFAVHLVNQGGEQYLPDYLKLNPQGLVPTLEENDHIITQSLAIIEYLEELQPTPSLFPPTALGRATVRSMALTVACDIHPLNNLRVLNYLRSSFKATEAQTKNWYHHWLEQGFNALEKRLEANPRQTKVCYGNEVSLADIFLVPQVYNAYRFEFPVDNYPLISEVYHYCCTLDPFKQAEPES